MPVSFRLHPSEKEGVFDRHRSHMNRSVLKDRLLEDDIPPKTDMSSKKGPFQKEISSSNR